MPVISRSPFFYRILPWFFAGFAVLWAVSALNTPTADPVFLSRWAPGLIVVFLSVGMLLVARKTKLADEVRDAGNALVVRQSGYEVRIPLTDIVKVDTRPYPLSRGTYYTALTLRTPCRFGSEVKFLPIPKHKFSSLDFGYRSQPPPVIKGLIERIIQARRVS
jgi:hypothetical protein